MKQTLALIFLVSNLLISAANSQPEELGQGAFRYRVVENWGREALASVKIKNGHGVIVDRMGRIVFLTDDPANNVIVMNADGKLIETWTARMPGAHGLTSAGEEGHECLFITDTALHEVRKFSITGNELLHLPWPESSGLYGRAAEYRPSKVLPSPNGDDFFVFDGYGKDYIHHYRADGTLIQSWGGDLGEDEDRLAHFGPHGGTVDARDAARPVILVCMSDRVEVKRFTLEGRFIDKFSMPGGNPRDATIFKEYLFIPHLGDNWPSDRNSTGFISVLDQKNRVISNVGGTPPSYSEDGNLKPMKSMGAPFIHPHALAIDKEGNMYVAQFASPSAPLLKLERLK